METFSPTKQNRAAQTQTKNPRGFHFLPKMWESRELPDCFYRSHPTLIPPGAPTPTHSLYLSNLDDQKFLRFSIKYLFLFRSAVGFQTLKSSLARVLVDYYPLAGRLRPAPSDDQNKLEVDCNAQGAVFAEAFMDVTADEFLQLSGKPNLSWRKLLCKVEARSFVDIPPLVLQATNLRCGAMILCTAINHCLCDGVGTSQFLHAWAHAVTNPDHDDPPIRPFHFRHALQPRDPQRVTFPHPVYTRNSSSHVDISQSLQSQRLAPACLTFTPCRVDHLKKRCVPSLKCTSFEALAAHTWRCWVRSLELSPSQTVKLLFSVNVRTRLIPELPQGYYGNGFVLACAETSVKELVSANIYDAVKLIQQAKSSLTNDYLRSMVDYLEDKTVKTDLTSSLVISQWAKLGLEDLDFGGGRPIHMGPLASDIYCLFLPAMDELNALKVLVSLPESVINKFEFYMKENWDKEENGDVNNGYYQI